MANKTFTISMVCKASICLVNYCLHVLDSSVNPIDSENLVSSSAYLLFYRRRSASPLGHDLSRKIAAHLESRKLEEGKEDLSIKQGLTISREVSVPPYQSDSSGGSPTTSSSGEPKPAPYVPFLGPGHQLGSAMSESFRASPAPSNPFSGSTWGSHVTDRIATTNSETSEQPETQFGEDGNEESTLWNQNSWNA